MTQKQREAQRHERLFPAAGSAARHETTVIKTEQQTVNSVSEANYDVLLSEYHTLMRLKLLAQLSEQEAVRLKRVNHELEQIEAVRDLNPEREAKFREIDAKLEYIREQAEIMLRQQK